MSAAPTCVVLLQAAHTFCVPVLYVHVVFDDKHVLNLMCVPACIYVYRDQANLYFILFYFYFLCSLSIIIIMYISSCAHQRPERSQ